MKSRGIINVTAQHFIPPPKPNSAFQYGTIAQMVDGIQHFNESFTTLFVFPGSPIHALDHPLFMYAVAMAAVN